MGYDLRPRPFGPVRVPLVVALVAPFAGRPEGQAGAGAAGIRDGSSRCDSDTAAVAKIQGGP